MRELKISQLVSNDPWKAWCPVIQDICDELVVMSAISDSNATTTQVNEPTRLIWQEVSHFVYLKTYVK